MTPEIVADAARRERLRCVRCGKLPDESVVRNAWGVSTNWICAACVGQTDGRWFTCTTPEPWP